MIHERQEHPGKHEDILNRLLEMHESDPEKLSFREVLAVTSINMYAIFLFAYALVYFSLLPPGTRLIS